jgi:hypothetical protein
MLMDVTREIARKLQRQSQYNLKAFGMSAAVLYRIDQGRNMHRLYRIDVQSDLCTQGL